MKKMKKFLGIMLAMVMAVTMLQDVVEAARRVAAAIMGKH